MTPIRAIPILLALLLSAGCATTECFKGDGLYEQNNGDCFRFCADANCKYWGYTRDDAEESLDVARVAAREEAVKKCRNLALPENSKEFQSCVDTRLRDRNLLEYQQNVNQRLVPNNYYFEK